MTKEGKEVIRQYTWISLILFILGGLVSTALLLVTGTLSSITQDYLFFIPVGIFIASLIGLFKYKKWGFYLIVIYFFILIARYAIEKYYSGVLLSIIFAFIILYRGFYKNLKHFE